ncbi:MAG: kinase [Actinomycetota bacterium]|jgi:NAD+ kinase|nr:kinase [Actinomycetota bacterium]
MTDIATAAFVVHDGKTGAVEQAAALRSLLESHGIKIEDDSPDLVIALGGDGTMLRAARLAHASDALLIGINQGTLGYLTEVESDHGSEALERILSGSYEVEERLMLDCTCGEGRSFVGLNEVLVERAVRHRLVRLAVSLGGERLASFNGDGVIVATPTGSTAYALSAGGPVVSPRASCLILVPVNAHMIFSRPFVLAPDETVEISLENEDHRASLVLDGVEGCDVWPNDVVTIRRHERPLRLVRTSGPGFVERLRAKLGLPG